MALERRMHGMPRPFPAIDAALAGDLVPVEVEGEALVADPFRPPLEGAAALAALDQKLAAAGRLPIGFVDAVLLGHRDRQPAPGEAPRHAHSAASPPHIIMRAALT